MPDSSQETSQRRGGDATVEVCSIPSVAYSSARLYTRHRAVTTPLPVCRVTGAICVQVYQKEAKSPAWQHSQLKAPSRSPQHERQVDVS